PVVQAALETVSALLGSVTVLAKAVWGLGARTIMTLAARAHVLIAVLHSESPDESQYAGH
ncbi:unnamed protein product, partial [Phaeothamnion confervicola]